MIAAILAFTTEGGLAENLVRQSYPFGYQEHTIDANTFSVVGVNLKKELLAAAEARLLINNQAIAPRINIPGLIGSEPALLEVTSGAASGTVHELSIDANGALLIAGESEPSVTGMAVGDTFEIWSANTIAGIFGDNGEAGVLPGSFETGDRIWVPTGTSTYQQIYLNDQTIDTFFESLTPGWRRFGVNDDMSERAIWFDQALYYQSRQAAELKLRIKGFAHSRDLWHPMGVGFNQIGTLFDGLVLGESGFHNPHTGEGLLSGDTDTADIIWNPAGNSAYDMLYYNTETVDSFWAPVTPGWRKTSNGFTDQSSAVLRPGILVKRQEPGPDFLQSAPSAITPPQDPLPAQFERDTEGRVELIWQTKLGYGYRIQTSTDRRTWTDEFSIYGSGAEVRYHAFDDPYPGAPDPPAGSTFDEHTYFFAPLAGASATLVSWTGADGGAHQVYVTEDFATLPALSSVEIGGDRLTISANPIPDQPHYINFTVSALPPEEVQKANLVINNSNVILDAAATTDAQGGGNGGVPAGSAGYWRINEVVVDTDGDKIPDHREWELGLDPMNADMDGDGIEDGAEIVGGASPTSSQETPEDVDPEDVDNEITYAHATSVFSHLWDQNNGRYVYSSSSADNYPNMGLNWSNGSGPAIRFGSYFATMNPLPQSPDQHVYTDSYYSTIEARSRAERFSIDGWDGEVGYLRNRALWLTRETPIEEPETKQFVEVTTITGTGYPSEGEMSTRVVELEIPSYSDRSDRFDVVAPIGVEGTGGDVGAVRFVNVKALAIDLEHAWSDQIEDVEVNGMPDVTGTDSKPYILMGARHDGKAYGKLRLRTGIPTSIRDRLLWRFAHSDEADPPAGSSNYEEDGTVVRVVLDDPSDEEHYRYSIYFGIDANGDGELKREELAGEIRTIHDPTSDGVRNSEEMAVTYYPISKERHNESAEELLTAAAFPEAVNKAPNAVELLAAFCGGWIPAGATSSVPVVIDRDQPGLTHPVGLKFTPPSNPLPSLQHNFDQNSSLAIDAIKTNSFKGLILTPENKAQWRKKVVGKYFDDPNDPATQHTPLDEDVTFDIAWEEIVGSNDIAFSALPGVLGGNGPTAEDVDLWLAVGKAKISGTLSVRANLLAQRVEQLHFTGSIDDVYDFDYDDTVPVPYIGEYVRRAAEVQSGHPTLGLRGRVVLTHIYYISTDLNFSFSFAGP